MKCCRVPNCVHPAGMGGYCKAHTKPTRSIRHSSSFNRERLQTPAWRKFSRSFIKEFPECKLCGDKAQHVHHLTPAWIGGDQDFDPEHFASLCNSCHSKITALELANYG